MSQKLSFEKLIEALYKGTDLQNIECDWNDDEEDEE